MNENQLHSGYKLKEMFATYLLFVNYKLKMTISYIQFYGVE